MSLNKIIQELLLLWLFFGGSQSLFAIFGLISIIRTWNRKKTRSTAVKHVQRILEINKTFPNKYFFHNC